MSKSDEFEVCFFACGAPSNNRGFEVVSFGPGILPEGPARYLEAGSPNGDIPAHGFRLIVRGDSTRVRYCRRIPVRPNDTNENRGAYIAVGFLASQQLPRDVVDNCISITSELVGRVRANLDGDSLAPGRTLTDVFPNVQVTASAFTHFCSAGLLADLFEQLTSATGVFSQGEKQIWISPSDLAHVEAASRLRLFSQETPSEMLLRQLDTKDQSLRGFATSLSEIASSVEAQTRSWAAFQKEMAEKIEVLSQQTRNAGSAWQGLSDKLAYVRSLKESAKQYPKNAFHGESDGPSHSTSQATNLDSRFVKKPSRWRGDVTRPRQSKNEKRRDAPTDGRAERNVGFLVLCGLTTLATCVSVAWLLLLFHSDERPAGSDDPHLLPDAESGYQADNNARQSDVELHSQDITRERAATLGQDPPDPPQDPLYDTKNVD